MKVTGDVDAFGQRAEGRAPVDEQDDLAIQEQVRIERGQAGEFGEGDRDIALGAAGQPQSTLAYIGENPHAVPLDLVHPLGSAGDLAGGRGEHRAHGGGGGLGGRRVDG